MRNFTLTTMMALIAVPAFSQTENLLIENPTIEKTYANWEGKKAIYDVSLLLGDAKATLEADVENVKVNSLEGWYETWGDMSRYQYQGGDNEAWLNASSVNGGTMQDWPQPLIGMYEGWWQWWSMAVCQQKEAVDLSHINGDTHLHMAVRIFNTPVAGPMNISFFTSEDNDDQNHLYACPKFSLVPENYDPEGSYKADYPIIGTLKEGEWTGIDLTLTEIEKINKDNNGDYIDYEQLKEFTGRIWTVAIPSKPDLHQLEGAVFGLDAIYFYTPVDELSGIESVAGAVAEGDVVVGAETVSVAGAEGIEIYNMAGCKVAETTGSVISTIGLKGVYVVKAADVTHKVVL